MYTYSEFLHATSALGRGVPPQEISLGAAEVEYFLMLPRSPIRFHGNLVENRSTLLEVRPNPGVARFLSRVPVRSGEYWDFVRQGDRIFVAPVPLRE